MAAKGKPAARDGAHTRPTPDEAWRAIEERDGRFDGVFYYAVRTTGVYCRPSCPSRRPRRQNVSIHFDRDSAERAGFRACYRCHPDSAGGTPAERRVLRALQYLESHLDERVTLEELGRAVGLSPFHLHRTFTQIVGLSPRRYQAARRLEKFKTQLKESGSVGRAVYDAGFASTREVYERARTALGMNPSEYRQGGRGREIRYTTVGTAFGRMLIGATDVGVAAVHLGDDDAQLEDGLHREFPHARILRDDEGVAPWAARIIAFIEAGHGHVAVPLDLQGTAFQLRVWNALQEIPPGETRSYRDIAARLGDPRAARAVARACATNHAALVVPCHRVVRSDGTLSGYRWGMERKRRILEREEAAAR